MDERPLSYAVAFAWSLVTAAVMYLLVSVIRLVRPGTGLDIVSVGAVEALAFTTCIYGFLRLHAPTRPVPAALGLRPTQPSLSLLGIALGVSLQVPAGSVLQLVERLTPTPESVLRNKAALLATDTTGHVVALLVVTACVAPLVEELLARGAVYGALCRSHPVGGAAAISALAWVMLHVDQQRNWPSLLLVASALAHLRAASGSVLPGLALHVAFNATTVLLMVTGVSSVTRPYSLGLPIVAVGWLATLGLVSTVQWVATRSPEAAAARLEDVR
jgi:membrane protease YdiL (CAAX protease family)